MDGNMKVMTFVLFKSLFASDYEQDFSLLKVISIFILQSTCIQIQNLSTLIVNFKLKNKGQKIFFKNENLFCFRFKTETLDLRVGILFEKLNGN